MKKITFIIPFLFLLFACNKNEEPKDKTITTEQIEQAYREIKISADSILLSDNPIEGFKKIAEEYRKMEEVKNVEVNSDALAVEFENGFICFWKESYLSENNISATNRSFNNINKEETTTESTQKKFCIINQASDDEVFSFMFSLIAELETLYNENNWETTIIPRVQATRDFLQSELNKYDAVYFSTHGNIYNDIIYLATGEYCDSELVVFFNEMLTNGLPINRTAIINLLERRNGNYVTISYKTVSSYDIQNYYSNRRFNNSFIYADACHGLQSEHLARAFVDNGAAVFMGWNEANCMGDDVAVDIFKHLLEGYTLEESKEHVILLGSSPDTHENLYHPDANLLYYPESASDFRLVNSSSEQVNLPSKITENYGDGADISLFEYDTKQRLTRYSYDENEEWGHIVTFNYSGEELAYTITHWNDINKDARLNFTKSGNKITCSGQENEKGEIVDVTYTITLNENGLPVTILEPYNGINTYEYDDNGNPVTHLWREAYSDVYGTSRKMEFDDKNGIFSSSATPVWWWYLNGPFYEYLNNNMKKETYTKGDVSNYVYTLTYNSDGYPEKIEYVYGSISIEY